MKAGKAPGPSGIISGGDDTSSWWHRGLHDPWPCSCNHFDGKVPSDWEQSFIVCLFKGKGDALEKGNYRGLKLTEQVMKILERTVDGLIRQLVSINNSQFGFLPGRGTTGAISAARQLQEKYLAANKRLYMAFVDLEKVFDRVPHRVIWWALRKLGVEEWTVQLVQGMYANVRSRVRVGEGYSEEFEVKVGVHQGSVLSPLLFIIVLEALSEFRSGVPWEDLYADDLVIIAESLEECVRRLLTWKEAMEKKGLRVNAGKTKIMICGTGLDLLQSSGEFPCAVCRTGVGSNSIFCNGCKHWVHKKCSGLKRLKKDPDYRCTRCQGNCTPLEWQTTEGSPGRIWQAWGGSFLLLLRRHALSSRWLWTFNHNTCENRLEEVQGSAISSLFTSPLFQNTWLCVQLLCAECNGPCQKDLAIDKAKPPASAGKWQGNNQTDLQCQTARHCHHQVQWATCVAWHWGSGPHSEGEKTPMVWTCETLQWCSQDSLWHTGWWKAWAREAQDDMETADWKGLQRVEALGHQPSW